jgi:hypothetical protein
MLLKKIGLIALALAFSSEMALANGGYNPKPNRKPKPHYKNGYVDKNYRHRSNRNYYRRGNNNYYHRGNNYYKYNYNYNNGNFYNDPYFWGGVAGGLIGGAIIQDYYQPECETIWVDVYIPGEGYRQQQTVVCD